MAELHILGQLQGVSDFHESCALFCRYSFQSGKYFVEICGLGNIC